MNSKLCHKEIASDHPVDYFLLKTLESTIELTLSFQPRISVTDLYHKLTKKAKGINKKSDNSPSVPPKLKYLSIKGSLSGI